MVLKKISIILKSYRSLHSLSQSEMAQVIGITREHYNKLENEKAKPHPKTKRKIANALGIKVEDL